MSKRKSKLKVVDVYDYVYQRGFNLMVNCPEGRVYEYSIDDSITLQIMPFYKVAILVYNMEFSTPMYYGSYEDFEFKQVLNHVLDNYEK